MMEFVRWATSTCTSLIQEYVIQQTHHTTGIIAQITSVNLCKVSNIMILTVGCCVGPDMNYRSKASVSIQETQPESLSIQSSVCSVIVRKDWLMINVLYSDQSIQKDTQMKLHLSCKDPASHLCSVQATYVESVFSSDCVIHSF